MEDPDQMLMNGSAIPMNAFQIVVGILFATAVVCLGSHLVWRIRQRSGPGNVDVLFCLAVACLASATGVVYKASYVFYLSSAILGNPDAILSIPLEELDKLPAQGTALYSSFSVLVWTTIFAIKAAILVTFRQSSLKLRWLDFCWKAAIVCILVAWILMFAAAFVLNPFLQFDHDYVTSRNSSLYIAAEGFITGLDLITSLSIATLLWIIRQRTLKQNMLPLFGSFSACLIMMPFSILSASKITSSGNTDVVWQAFWNYLEAAIALSVISVARLDIPHLISQQPGLEDRLNPTHDAGSGNIELHDSNKKLNPAKEVPLVVTNEVLDGQSCVDLARSDV